MELPVIDHQPYDLLIGHRPAVVIRLNDEQYKRIDAGDVVEIRSQDGEINGQLFKIVSRHDHFDMHEAIEALQHSALSTRDKITLSNAFQFEHGLKTEGHPVVVFQMEPQRGPLTRTRGEHRFGGE
jgi:hypothetical protein